MKKHSYDEIETFVDSNITHGDYEDYIHDTIKYYSKIRIPIVVYQKEYTLDHKLIEDESLIIHEVDGIKKVEYECNGAIEAKMTTFGNISMYDPSILEDEPIIVGLTKQKHNKMFIDKIMEMEDKGYYMGYVIAYKDEDTDKEIICGEIKSYIKDIYLINARGSYLRIIKNDDIYKGKLSR